MRAVRVVLRVPAGKGCIVIGLIVIPVVTSFALWLAVRVGVNFARDREIKKAYREGFLGGVLHAREEWTQSVYHMTMKAMKDLVEKYPLAIVVTSCTDNKAGRGGYTMDAFDEVFLPKTAITIVIDPRFQHCSTPASTVDPSGRPLHH